MRRIFQRAWTAIERFGGAVRRVLTPSDQAWRAASWAMLALWAAIPISFVLLEVVPRFTFERFVGQLTLFVALALVSLGVLLIVRLLSLLQPRYRFALLLAMGPVALFLLVVWQAKGMVLGGLMTLAGFSLTAGSIAALVRPGPVRRRRYGAIVFLLGGAALLATLAFGLSAPPKDPNPTLAHYRLAGMTLDLPDPGKPGPYRVHEFTYGSGTDRYRPEYAARASWRSRPVDGSRLDEVWKGPAGALRSLYWGFGPKTFPVQGRVWAPEGRGPFPLVLIVHGNHDMERFSDPGYAYLGELLASQGFILVSVDENFLNSSLADYVNPLKPRTGDENDARGWMLLEHLVQWRGWNADPANPLYGRVDFDRSG